MFFIFVVLLLTSFVFSLGFKRLTSSSCSYCLVLEFAHKSGYGVIMHFYKLFRVLTLFSENCSYNTLRFIFIILLPVKAAWPHDDDDFFFFFFFFFDDDEATSLGKQNTTSQDEGVEPYTNNSLNESNAKIVFP